MIPGQALDGVSFVTGMATTFLKEEGLMKISNISLQVSIYLFCDRNISALTNSFE